MAGVDVILHRKLIHNVTNACVKTQTRDGSANAEFYVPHMFHSVVHMILGILYRGLRISPIFASTSQHKNTDQGLVTKGLEDLDGGSGRRVTHLKNSFDRVPQISEPLGPTRAGSWAKISNVSFPCSITIDFLHAVKTSAVSCSDAREFLSQPQGSASRCLEQREAWIYAGETTFPYVDYAFSHRA
ncbi:hypothetical protein ARMGADRAFT_1035065 [Armillaria gallica]|uniref:Uncharacterized protein n=1 Tax=Armillaria gallica TaxID=47427 RepID=A0A2H3CVV7_ARMGA|nr:hypothetical protein ARMGADRAFT_1035065 [Armillaria gallica]